ncbi:MAG: hypothetical protein AAFX85_12380, partial [Pseudomonadota bacterium]
MSQQHITPDAIARRSLGAPRVGWALALVLLLTSPGADVFSQTDDTRYFTPNFVGVDVQEVIRIVANETGRSFIVDARVKGPVTFF